MYILKKRAQKLKNIISSPYNFALKIETSWAKKVVKPILETWNAVNDIIVNVWFIHSLIKNFNNMQYKKE